MVYFISDLHFGHDKDFLYSPRNFNTIQEHDAAIITLWNETVDEDDVVYILGDLMLNDNEHGLECLKQLNGEIHFIIGNHDTFNRVCLYESIGLINEGYATMMKFGKWSFYLSHYPTMVGGTHNMKDKIWCLCGHTHTKDKFSDMLYKNYHVDADAHYCIPISLDEILIDIKDYLQEFERTVEIINASNRI